MRGSEKQGVCENRNNAEGRNDVGRLINKLSHQLKRQMCIQEEEDSLTTNMQRLVLHYILFEVPEKRDLPEGCGKGVSDPEIYCDRNASDSGKERIYY